MKSLSKFIVESQNNSQSVIDNIMKDIKSNSNVRFAKVVWAYENTKTNIIWSPITYTIVTNEKAVIFSFFCEKKQPLLNELGELVGREPKYNVDEDFASIKIFGENVAERSQKLLDYIAKNIKKFNFAGDEYISIDLESVEKYKATRTAFKKKSFEEQMKDLDSQIKALEEQKNKLQDLQNFLNNLEKK